MSKFKNIRVKMRGGKSRLQRVQVLASGKYKFVKNIGRRVKSRVTRRTRRTRRSNVKRRVNRTARRYRKKRRGGGGKSIQRTVFKFIRIGALVGSGAVRYSQMTGDPMVKAGRTLISYGGMEYDGSFSWGLLSKMWAPFLAACGATYGIPKLIGIIRKL